MGKRYASLVPKCDPSGKSQRANDCQRIAKAGNDHPEEVG
jgi:hypothetical protein